MFLLQAIFAVVFMYVEDLPYGLALYHCFVTATTVGYGDVSITTRGGRRAATRVHRASTRLHRS